MIVARPLKFSPKRTASRELKTVYYDLETAPYNGDFWDIKRPYNIIRIRRYSYMLSVSWQINDGPIQCKALPDFPLYKKDKHDDYELVKFLHELLSNVDGSIGHNGDNFDDKYSNTRFIFHRLGPPRPRWTRDTLKLSKRVTKQVSHRLDELARFYGIGSKLPHTGKHLWQECTDDVYHPEAWNTMRRYNKHDVYLLKEVSKLLLPWDTNKNIPGLFTRNVRICPKIGCEGTRRWKQGYKMVRNGRVPQYQCLDCMGWYVDYNEFEKLPKLTIR